MEIWRHSLDAAPPFGPCLATLGNFDGVHAGHRQLLEQIRQRAQSQGLPSVVISFDPHPTLVTVPEKRPRLLMTLPQRLEIFQQLGVDLAWMIPFGRELSEMAPEAFLKQLHTAIKPRELHVGKGFRFGQNQVGNLDTLKAWGQGVGCAICAHGLKAMDGGPLSSTRIREALDRGDVQEAALLLGQPFAVTGVVVQGEQRGRHLGFPTANLAWEQEQLPAQGVYVVKVREGASGAMHLGLTNIGHKPTFQGTRLTVETHILDFQGDLYGTRLEVMFLHRLRGEQRFESVAALRQQIAEDIAQGRAWGQVQAAPSC